jgi:hypothetical protein
MPLGNTLDYTGFQKPDAYTPYAAGPKTYGMSRRNPTQGPVDNAGYQERDMIGRARRAAILSRMQNQQAGNYMSPAVLRGM